MYEDIHLGIIHDITELESTYYHHWSEIRSEFEYLLLLTDYLFIYHLSHIIYLIIDYITFVGFKSFFFLTMAFDIM